MSSDEHTRVYTEGGTVVHFLDSLVSPNSSKEALCGRTPWPGFWHGTGTQEERERALDLRVCSQCQSVLSFRAGGMVTR